MGLQDFLNLLMTLKTPYTCLWFPHVAWESRSDGNGTLGIIFQLNYLYFLPWCTSTSVAFGNEVCLWFVRVWKQERQFGAGQSVARHRTPQLNNILNIHQIVIYYLAEFLSILQMCMSLKSLAHTVAESCVCVDCKNVQVFFFLKRCGGLFVFGCTWHPCDSGCLHKFMYLLNSDLW